MGDELRLRVEGGTWPPTVVTPETFLRRLPLRTCFASYALLATPSNRGTELRVATNVSGMPDVVIEIREDGFYVLDNNATLASLVLGEITRYLLGSFDRITIEAV